MIEYWNDNKSVLKIDNDGVETCVKCCPKTATVMNYNNPMMVPLGEPDKYSVFISSTQGCVVGCKFCYLTTKKCRFKRLSTEQIINNTKVAIQRFVQANPKCRDKCIKLSWMGMGEPLFDIFKVVHVTKVLIQWIQAANMAVGIDRVDIGTTLPLDHQYIMQDIISLNEWVEVNANTRNNPDSVVRLFYSLHSLNEDMRRNLIPIMAPLKRAQKFMDQLMASGITVILHQFFLEGINDDVEYIDQFCQDLYEFQDGWPMQLRILRFNECPGGEYMESKRFVDIIHQIRDNIDSDLMKLQFSPGAEITSACGQFLVNK